MIDFNSAAVALLVSYRQRPLVPPIAVATADGLRFSSGAAMPLPRHEVSAAIRRYYRERRLAIYTAYYF